MSCELTKDLGPALALDVLEGPERELLEMHLERCPDCARTLVELRQVATGLGLALSQYDPPPALGERILAAAAADLGAGERVRNATTLPDRAGRVSVPVTRSGSRAAEPPRGRAGGTQLIAPAPHPPPVARALALASLAAAIAALLWGLSLQSQLGLAQQQVAESRAQFRGLLGAYETVVEVLASPAVQELDLQAGEAAPTARGRVWVDQTSGQGMMMARNLPPLSEGYVYQVWLHRADGSVSSGFLRAYDGGVYYSVLQAPSKITDYDRLGVTPEPLGGSPGPTGPRVIGGEI